MRTKLPTKAEVVESIYLLGFVVFVITVPFFIGVQVTKYFRWGCG